MKRFWIFAKEAQWSSEGEDTVLDSKKSKLETRNSKHPQTPQTNPFLLLLLLCRFNSTRIKTNNRQLYAVPELKLKQDGNSGSALRSIFALGEKNKNKNKKDRLVKKKK
jgi:hypothetical protein